MKKKWVPRILTMVALLALALPGYAVTPYTDTFDGASGGAPFAPWTVTDGSPTHNGAGQLACTDPAKLQRTIGAGDFEMNLSWTTLWLGNGVENYENAFYQVDDPAGGTAQHFTIKMQEQPNSSAIFFFCRAWIDGEAYNSTYDYASNKGALLGPSAPGWSYDLQVVYDDTAFTFDVYYAINGGAMTHLLTRTTPPAWVASTASRTELLGLQTSGDAAGLLDSYDMPGAAPLSTDDSITITEDTPTALSTDDFGTYDANGGDAFAEVKITTLESAGDLEYDTTGGGAWADVTLDQVISVADITAGRLRFSPVADADQSPHATIGFKVGNGTDFSVSAYTLTVNLTPVQDAPTASDNAVETVLNTDYTFTAADFNFADVDTGDSLTQIQVTQLETVGDLKLSGGDVALNDVIILADLTAGNLKYTPLAGESGAPYDTFQFKVHDGTEYSASAYTLTVNVTEPWVLWEGGVDLNWNTAGNWSDNVKPGTADQVLFDGAVSANNNIVLNANFQIRGLKFQNNVNANWYPMNDGAGTLTIQDDNDNAVFIEYDEGGSGNFVRLQDTIVFNDNLTIKTTGTGIGLVFNVSSLTGGANGVTFSADTGQNIWILDTPMSWSGASTIEKGTLIVNNTGSGGSVAIGGTGVDVSMATVGNATITWVLKTSLAYANANDFVLGTAGNSTFQVLGGVGTVETLTLQGDFTGGDAARNLNFDTANLDSIVLDTTVDIDVDSRLQFLAGDGDVTLSGTLTKADGGVLIQSGHDLDGTGTIKFTLVSATTTGPSNFGDLPIALDGGLDISAMTADFTGSTVDGASDYPLIAIDGAATLTGTFASETALPAGYEIQYTATEVKLVFVPGAPLSTDDAITINEDTPTALSTDDFGAYDANGGDPFAEVKITTLESAGDLEYDTTGGGAWADVTLDQDISVADITAGRLRFSPVADADQSPHATIGFKVGNGTDFSTAAYTLTVNLTPVQDAPTAANNTVETVKDTDYTFAVGDFNFADVDTLDSLTKIQVTQLETVGDLKLSGGDVALNDEILVADLTAGNLKYTPLAGESGAPYDTFQFKVHDGTEYSASAYTLTVNVTEPWVVWEGGVDLNWNTAGNWSDNTKPGTGDQVLFDGNVSANNNIVLNASFQIQGLKFQNNVNANWYPLKDGAGTLTLQDDNDNAVFIEYDEGGSGNFVRLEDDIVFNDDLTIKTTGTGIGLVFTGSSLTGANGSGVTFSAEPGQNFWILDTATSWSGATALEKGTLILNNYLGTVSAVLGDAGVSVSMATVGNAQITWVLPPSSTYANDNDFALGTAGNSTFLLLGGAATVETLTLQGAFTGGDTARNLNFDTANLDSIVLDTTVDIDVDSRLQFLAGDGDVTLSGTLTKADGGVLIQSGHDLDGAGTIKFTLASATTTGPSNFGDLPIDLQGGLDISAMTADFTGSTVDGASDYPLIAIAGGATLTGEFASETQVPAGYQIQYTATEVKLAAPPTGTIFVFR